MNDRYLFRAKRIDNGEWVEGYYLFCPIQADNKPSVENFIYKHWIVTHNGNPFEVDPSTICQCTGLKDKNGKLIWENDVVCTSYVDPIFGDIVNDEILDDYTWKVVFVDGGFCVENEDNIINLRSFTNGNHIKAIGNIFDNPELLEK